MTQIVIKYGNGTSRIAQDTLTYECINDLSEECSFEVQGSEHMKRSGKFGKRGNWDGRKRLYHKQYRTFPTGLLDRVDRVLRRHGFDPHIVGRDSPRQHDRIEFTKPWPEEYRLRDYQKRIHRQMLVGHSRGMVKLATGGGKTVIAARAIRDIALQTVFFVHTRDLLIQTRDAFTEMLGSDVVGQIGDGVIVPNYVTVCTIQTAARALNVDYHTDSFADGDENWTDKDTERHLGDGSIVRSFLGGCGLVFMDECHRVAAPSASEVVLGVEQAQYRFGLSASPWRDDGADIVLEGVFGETICDVNASSLIDIGALVPPIIRFKRVEPMRFPKTAKYSEIYDEYIVNNDTRNNLIVDDACRKYRQGIPTLVLVRRIKQGITIRERIEAALGHSVPYLTGSDNSSLRYSVLSDMRESRLKLLIATTIADEGLDIKPLAGLVLGAGGKSSTRALQRVGRVLRPFPGKQVAHVTDFEDNARILLDHSVKRLDIYKTEPRFEITDI